MFVCLAESNWRVRFSSKPLRQSLRSSGIHLSSITALFTDTFIPLPLHLPPLFLPHGHTPLRAKPSSFMSATVPAHSEELGYNAKTPLYSLAWSYRQDRPPRLAVGSFTEEYNNKVEILQHNPDSIDLISAFDHPYPTTKVSWIPDREGIHPDLVGTTGDFLRLWQIDQDGQPKMKCLLNINKHSESCAPLTAFDWNEADPSLVGTSSIDTTCTVWNVETQQSKTQLIAHDKEVYDFAFAARGVDVFASVGADGSVRLFDLRSLESSTIIYESPDMTPLLRLRWNTHNPNYLATIALDSPELIILDIRQPSLPVALLDHRSATSANCVNAVSWAPHSSVHLASGGDGCLALIWNISSIQKRVEDPAFSYYAGSSISNLQWSPIHAEWLALTYDNKVQILRV